MSDEYRIVMIQKAICIAYIEVEAMKIANLIRERDGTQYAYDDNSFFQTQQNLENQFEQWRL